ncbi:hypothetical protein ACJX0J_019561, partial [Zea mays]
FSGLGHALWVQITFGLETQQETSISDIWDGVENISENNMLLWWDFISIINTVNLACTRGIQLVLVPVAQNHYFDTCCLFCMAKESIYRLTLFGWNVGHNFDPKKYEIQNNVRAAIL